MIEGTTTVDIGMSALKCGRDGYLGTLPLFWHVAVISARGSCASGPGDTALPHPAVYPAKALGAIHPHCGNRNHLRIRCPLDVQVRVLFPVCFYI